MSLFGNWVLADDSEDEVDNEDSELEQTINPKTGVFIKKGEDLYRDREKVT